MIIEVMDADKSTAYLVSRLLYEKHIYDSLEDVYKDVFGAHELLQEIEFGYRTVVGFWADGDFLGCAHGILEENTFTAHLLFKRHVDVVKNLLLAEKVLLEYCSKKGFDLKYIDGFIPPFNRAAVCAVRRYGAKFCRVSNDIVFLKNNIKIPCLHFRKEIA